MAREYCHCNRLHIDNPFDDSTRQVLKTDLRNLRHAARSREGDITPQQVHDCKIPPEDPSLVHHARMWLSS